MRRIRQLAAVAVLLVLLLGVPWAMAVTIGNPLHGWGALKAGDLSDAVVIDILAGIVWVAIWVAWAQFAIAFVTAVREALQARAQAPGSGWPDLAAAPALTARVPGEFTGIPHLARWLVATALLVGTAANIASPAARAAADTPRHAPAAVAVAVVQALPHAPAPGTATTGHASTHASPTAATRQAGTRTYVVPADGSGPDTYWDIAQTMLGSGEHWHEIWDLNRGRTQPDGSVMTQAGLLQPGWTVLVPTQGEAASGEQVVPVVADDTLTQIAVDHDSTEAAVWDANKGRTMSDGRAFTDPDLILPGDTILIPAPASTPHPAPRPQPAPPTTTTGTPTAPSTPGPASIPPVTPPATPAPTTPASTAPAANTPSAAAHSADHAQAHSSSEAPVLAFAAGGGLLLAGVSLTALVAYRRRQWRYRHPGRTIANTEPDLIRMERAVLAAGRPAQADVTWLDQALRGLVQGVADIPGARLPDVIAVRVSADDLELVLTGPAVSAPHRGGSVRTRPGGPSAAATRSRTTRSGAGTTSRRSPRWPPSGTTPRVSTG